MPGRSHPSVIHVEPTTRCNMRCSMCVKTAMPHAPEGDLPLETFQRLGNAFGHASRVVFAGIGEPLLHPGLPDMIRFARERLPADGRILMQTNGLLLHSGMARRLLDSGLDTVCISVDSLDSSDGLSLHGAARAGGVSQAFRTLRDASLASGRPVRLGAEIVLMRGNMDALPDLVRFAGQCGARFVIVSHVFAFTQESALEPIFNPNTDEATAFFEKWSRLAAFEGLDLSKHLDSMWTVRKSPDQKRLIELVNLMQQEANTAGVSMNVRGLVEWSRQDRTRLREALDAARSIAQELDLELSLPNLSARLKRRCDFMEDGAAFVSWRGDVSPCHFLWRDYRCFMDGHPKQVNAVRFGNIAENALESIWRGPSYTEFRAQARGYEYAYCSNCNSGPCSDVTARYSPFEPDCSGSNAPCGHCPWPVGQLACLG